MPWIGPELDEGFDMSTMKVRDIPADLTATLSRPGGYITVSLADGLEILESYFERYSDVDDGPYGEPVANEAMSLLSLVKDLQEAFCDEDPNV